MKADHKPKPPVSTKGLIWKVPLIAIVIIGLLVIATDLVAVKDRTDRAASSTNQTGGTNATASTPAPWYYDEANNQHWHAEHGHWHPGPPPAEANRNQVMQTNATPVIATESTPEPWFYDAEKNQHWDPGHGHWHSGPPPAEADRNNPSNPH